MKELTSEQIARGIDESIVGSFFKGLVYGLFGIVMILLLLLGTSMIYNSYHKLDNSHLTVARQVNCNYPYVECSISDHTKLMGGELICPDNNPNTACARTSEYFPILETRDICGYQEAKAWFELYKEDYPLNSSKLAMVCTQ